MNMVFSGTAVARGRGRAVVTATGMSTEMGTVARLLGRTRERRTPLQVEVDRIGRRLGIAVIAIAVVVVTAILLTADIGTASDVVSVLLVGVALAVAAVPEGLPAVLSVVLAFGMQRMARQRAIVKRLASVETLGSASVICSDKTGTLTKNEMTVQKVVTGSGEVDVTGSGYRPEGELRVGGRPLEDPVLLAEVRAVLAGGSLANDAVLREEDGEWTIHGDPTEAAFLVAEARSGPGRVAPRALSARRRDPVHLRAQADEHGARGARGRAASRCSPRARPTCCSRAARGTGRGPERALTDEPDGEILAGSSGSATWRYGRRRRVPAAPGRRASAGGRVGGAGAGLPRRGRHHRPAAAGGESRDRRRDAAGMRVMMITGDHPRTARGSRPTSTSRRRLARRLRPRARGNRRQGPVALVREASVYARVSPEHKLRIVDALQRTGGSSR